MVSDSLFRGKHAPIGAVLGLQPLEVVDLIPLVLDLLIGLKDISFWQRRESHVLAVLDDGPAGAEEVDVAGMTFVHAELATRDDDDAVLDTCHVCGTVDMTTNEERVLDVLEG